MFGHAGQTVRAHQRKVHERAQGAQGLVGADVGRGLGAADVLLAGLQGEHIAGAAFQIRGAAHDTAGELADMLLAAGHDAQIGAAEAQGLAQALAFGHGDVGAHLAGSLEHGLHDRIDGDDAQSLAGAGMGEKLAEVGHGAEEVGVLHQHGGAGGVHGGLEAFHIAQAVLVGHGHQGDVQAGGVGLQHGPPDGIDALVHHQLFAAGGAHGHHAGLEQGRTAVIDGGIGAIHVQQAAHRGLVFEDGLQGALRAFGLIGRVGGIELAAAGKGVHGAGHIMGIEARAQEGDGGRDVGRRPGPRSSGTRRIRSAPWANRNVWGAFQAGCPQKGRQGCAHPRRRAFPALRPAYGE